MSQAPTLVVVQLEGGNDPLNTIVPYADPLYYDNRPTVRIPEADVLKIDQRYGFHPAMAELNSYGLLTGLAGIDERNTAQEIFSCMYDDGIDDDGVKKPLHLHHDPRELAAGGSQADRQRHVRVVRVRTMSTVAVRSRVRYSHTLGSTFGFSMEPRPPRMKGAAPGCDQPIDVA